MRRAFQKWVEHAIHALVQALGHFFENAFFFFFIFSSKFRQNYQILGKSMQKCYSSYEGGLLTLIQHFLIFFDVQKFLHVYINFFPQLKKNFFFRKFFFSKFAYIDQYAIPYKTIVGGLVAMHYKPFYKKIFCRKFLHLQKF